MAEFFTSDFWEAIVLAIIAIIAAGMTAWLGFRDLRLRRRLETSKQFLTLFATAHGRPVDGRANVGVGEQVASVHLIADFAKQENKLLKNAACEGLAYLATWEQDIESEEKRTIGAAARQAKARFDS